MVKAGVYLVLRLAPAFYNTHLSAIIAAYGGFVLLATAAMALSQSNAKKVLAYSTIGNLGLIILCAGINTPLAIGAGIVVLLFHAVSKAILFMTVGAIEGEIGSRDIEAMEGLCRRAPSLSGILVIGVLSMIAPPFGVLVGKWAVLEASADLFSKWTFLVITLLALGSGVTVVFWVKWLARALSGTPEIEECQKQCLPAPYAFSLWGLVAVLIVLSVLGAPLVAKLVVPAVGKWYPFTPSFIVTRVLSLKVEEAGRGVMPVLFLAVTAILFLVLPWLLVKVKREIVKPVYLCGENVEFDTKWRGLADKEFDLSVGGFYFQNTVGEERLNIWAIALTAAGLAFTLAVGLYAWITGGKVLWV